MKHSHLTLNKTSQTQSSAHRSNLATIEAVHLMKEEDFPESRRKWLAIVVPAQLPDAEICSSQES